MVSVKVLFTITFFQILLFEGRSVLTTDQQVTGIDWVKFSVRNKNHLDLCLNYLKSYFGFMLGDFE